MAKAIRCPYFERRTDVFVLCEGGYFKSFDSKDETRQFVNHYCGHASDWLKCDYAKELEKSYGMDEKE
ncbi:MAG: hypothetical protein ACRCX8_01325 [Sarcina sp.]